LLRRESNPLGTPYESVQVIKPRSIMVAGPRIARRTKGYEPKRRTIPIHPL